MKQELKGHWKRWNHEHCSEDLALKFGRTVLFGQDENMRIEAGMYRHGKEELAVGASAFLVKEVK